MIPLISSQAHSVSRVSKAVAALADKLQVGTDNTIQSVTAPVTQGLQPQPKHCKPALTATAPQADVPQVLLEATLNIPCLLEFWSKDVFTEMLSTVVHFLSRDCGSLILLISRFTFKFEFIPESTHSLWDTD